LVAALLLSASDTPDPEERFYANVVLTTTKFYETWLLETEDVVNSLISERWLRVTQYERFSLHFPSVNAEAISRICRDESCKGLRKAARVLLTARHAVHISVTGKLLNILQERAR
jgi:hypothetical protein